MKRSFLILLSTAVHAHVPTITTHFTGTHESFSLSSNHLKQQVLLHGYDHGYFNAHLLPQTSLKYRINKKKSIPGAYLSQEIEYILHEIQQGSREFTRYTILKDKEFDYKTRTGTIIVKMNEYPFVVKLFIETPHSFLYPHTKGMQAYCMWLTSGGINRHLAGFNRLKNREYIAQQVKGLPTHLQFDLPRKWFWLPKKSRTITLTGSHFPGTWTTKIPAIYGIVADEIVCTDRLSKIRKEQGKNIFKICQELHFAIDPNMKNFRIEQATGKLVLIDTEHFPSLLGLEKELHASNYFSLHLKMGYTVLKHMLS